MPCCMSTTSESQPALAMTSAEKLDGMPSQLLMTGLPACHNSRTPLGRAMVSSWVQLRERSRQRCGPVSSQAASLDACSACFCRKFTGSSASAAHPMGADLHPNFGEIAVDADAVEEL